MKLRWVRCSKRLRCPVCDKPDYCTIAPDAGLVHCQRIDNGQPAKGNAGGWIHRLGDKAGAVVTLAKNAPETKPLTQSQLDDYQRRSLAGLTHDLRWPLFEETGIALYEQRQLGVGFDGEHWTFPMRHPIGNRILGFRLRFRNGRKLSLKGGREGLFLPADWAAPRQRLWIVEGPTDTAAMLALGFKHVIGRPCALGGAPLILKAIEYANPYSVIIIADNDEPDKNGIRAGLRGAEILCKQIAAVGTSCRVVLPPAKDVRLWKAAGATSVDIIALLK
jgi:hypothetical protein